MWPVEGKKSWLCDSPTMSSELMRRSEGLSAIAPHLPEIRARYHFDTLHMFGYAARDELTDSSDIDILVHYTRPPTQMITLT